MPSELSYVITTPYTLARSRTGGVLSRLLSRADLELVGAQIFALHSELTEQYALSIASHSTAEYQREVQLLHDYVLANFAPSEGRRHRVALLVFAGENACKKLKNIVGALPSRSPHIDTLSGETIRDTYADLLVSPSNPSKVRYFEPAVLTPSTFKEAKEDLRRFAEFAIDEPNIVENISYANPDQVERTLVILKPDNWRFPSSRPGAIIDMFSRTGLRIIGWKLHRMSVAQALEFYGPVKDVLREKLSESASEKAAGVLEREFKCQISSECRNQLRVSFGIEFADEHFHRIIEFMSGRHPLRICEKERQLPGVAKGMVLVYEGIDAVRKIREVLGPTDPTKAPVGTIRREFGSNIMVNTAHASDSVESVKRESEIVNIQKNDMATVILDMLSALD